MFVSNGQLHFRMWVAIRFESALGLIIKKLRRLNIDWHIINYNSKFWSPLNRFYHKNNLSESIFLIRIKSSSRLTESTAAVKFLRQYSKMATLAKKFVLIRYDDQYVWDIIVKSITEPEGPHRVGDRVKSKCPGFNGFYWGKIISTSGKLVSSQKKRLSIFCWLARSNESP